MMSMHASTGMSYLLNQTQHKDQVMIEKPALLCDVSVQFICLKWQEVDTPWVSCDVTFINLLQKVFNSDVTRDSSDVPSNLSTLATSTINYGLHLFMLNLIL